MSNLDEREKGFERKFQQDQEFAFKVKSRRNRIVGHWAANLLGKEGADADAYAATVVAAELEKHGEEHVIDKLVTDLAGKGVDRHRVMEQLDKAMAQARKELGAPN